MADEKQTEFPFDNEPKSEEPVVETPVEDEQHETPQNDGDSVQVQPESQPGVSGVVVPDADEQVNEAGDEAQPDVSTWSVYDTADGRRYEQTAEQIAQELGKRGVKDPFHGEGDYIASDASVIQVRRAGRDEGAAGPHTKAPIEDEQLPADAPVSKPDDEQVEAAKEDDTAHEATDKVTL